MAKQLVIVESPTKASTIGKYLGPDYVVDSSVGHIRDLPSDRMGVDTEHDFEPEYVVHEDKEHVIARLKSALRKTDGLVLATDFDREGEAIAWHVAEVLGVDSATAPRVTFTEITKAAIQEAFANPRTIDMSLVEAQQARRILDRLVGYTVSPLLSKSLKRGLSAGRVQSVAVRLIVEREREIRAFNPVEYWSVDARLSPNGDDAGFVATLIQVGEDRIAASPDKKGLVLSTEADAQAHVERLREADYRVSQVTEKERKQNPKPPFTTSTLQQEASRKLGFGAKRTMSAAQRLYEGVKLPGEGEVGLITYMRTDSVNISETALQEITQVVRTQYGDAYALEEPRRYSKKQRGAQEAHEAIRPTSAARHPDVVAPHIKKSDDARLYRLIWQRTVASQMAQARFNQVSVDIAAKPAGTEGPDYLLRATGQTLLFDGFRRVYWEGRDDAATDEDAESMLPALTAEQALRLLELLPEQHFTQPPPRFTEASLVKTLEENGIGRPSTYASIVSVIQDRGYVRLEEKRFFAEDIGEVVTDILTEHFPDVVDVGFTSHMEEELDDIAEGKLGWTQVLDEFYGPFERALEKAGDQIKPPVEDLDLPCPKCAEEGREGGELQLKLGRFGKFTACSNYPECKYTAEADGTPRPEPELLDEICPECKEHQLMQRVGRYGPFIGCSGYPDCKYIKKEAQQRVGTGVQCPQCGKGEIVQRRGRFGLFYSCERYPDCDFSLNQMPIPKPCPECGGVIVEARGNQTRCIACNRAWDPEGQELPEEEAQKLIPKPRGGGKKAPAKKAPAKKASTKKSAAKKKRAPASSATGNGSGPTG